ncbi:hypothetical protein [Bradyrhizobium sp. 1]|uniref:hypothetical protein n=1 Tax=Bradyrhizobium sp. 1 TaxID=241591 RepID=UPI001FF981E2|nr:hypothetical protein [Bradyrhizobium sp. 1]MCK1395998.1 hypothetical protein [Bradyrhizobium sp. 1]
MDKAQAERRLDELHKYIQHIFTLFIGWFTFFGTVNFAAMGWMGASTSITGTFNGIAWLVPVMFITQNICGLAATYFVWRHVKDYDIRVLKLEQRLVPGKEVYDRPSSVPIRLYTQVMWLIGLALIVIAVVWGGVLKILLGL